MQKTEFCIFVYRHLEGQVTNDFFVVFQIGQSEVYIISPDTKKVAIEKSFKEISFCSQVAKF